MPADRPSARVRGSAVSRLVGLTGRKGSGKDTVGALLRRVYGFRTLAFADPLKAAAREWYGLTREQTDGPLNLKEATDPRWGLSPREILQRLGTEVGRSIHPETWTRYALRRIDGDPRARWAVTDVRFPNEADAIRLHGGFLIRIDRPGFATGRHEEHASERVDEVLVDHVLVNDGTLDDLARRLADVVGPPAHGEWP